MRPKHLASAAELAEDRPHGLRLRYMAGCHCLPCRAANARYECERARARKLGDWNGLVPAWRARRHILRLSRQGVGRRAIADASDIPQSIVALIRSGRRKNIRKRTQDRILGVNIGAASDATLVPARKMWRQIGELLQSGFSKAEIARRLGFVTPALQFGRDRVHAQTAARVDRLYRIVTKK